jgi:hypothetical protein
MENGHPKIVNGDSSRIMTIHQPEKSFPYQLSFRWQLSEVAIIQPIRFDKGKLSQLILQPICNAVSKLLDSQDGSIQILGIHWYPSSKKLPHTLIESGKMSEI